MTSIALQPKPLAQTLWPTDNAVVRNTILAVLGSAALWVSAKISIPFWQVPFTMQTLVVLMIGMAFGPRLGIATVLLYLAGGAAGLPVFSGTPEKDMSVAYMMNTTGGYLMGFVLAAGVVGYLAERGWDKPVFAWRLTPFLAGDALKLVLAATLMPALWKLPASSRQ